MSKFFWSMSKMIWAMSKIISAKVLKFQKSFNPIMYK